MDRAALIRRLREWPKYSNAEMRFDAASALAADAQKEAALKALCDEREALAREDLRYAPVRTDEIRAIYGWSNEKEGGG